MAPARGGNDDTSAVLQLDRQPRIEDRYLLEDGTVLLSGVQAAIRMVFDQMRADRRRGLGTGALVSGYPGSPLGGLDMELARQREPCAQLDVVHRPAVNEDLAATTVWGSQHIAGLPGPRVEGVLGVWYGKAPGVERSGDALRHGSFGGAHPLGGLIALCGDDPNCKSSTLPSASERFLSALGMPVLAPGTPQEVLDLGRHAVAMSRASGTWAALKLASNVADAVATVQVAIDRITPVEVTVTDNGRPYVHQPSANFAPPVSIEMERTLRGPRLALVREYTHANGLDRIAVDPPRARVGLIASGAAFHDLREALLVLGLDDEALRALGVRVLKLGIIWPVEPRIVRQFARGLEEIVVVEEKGPFLESAIRDILYGGADAPRIVGERDESGAGLMPASGALDPDLIARVVGPRLQALGTVPRLEAALARLQQPVTPAPATGPQRIPFFCSGCPHNSSTDVAPGTLVGAGIGCHTMVALVPEGKGEITGLTQMGGEGAQWLGQAPFVAAEHLIQNLGDGTFHHSASLAIRAAVAAGENITYKLLYNDAVSMTGGQTPVGQLSVPDLTRWLALEGVRRIIVTTDDVGRYRGVALADIAEVRDRSQLDAAQTELAAVPGTTVLIHDQACAAELRRLRKRGRAPEPAARAFINERVCEGCGDCGRKSHCLSVVPVQTEFGQKTAIHQASCNEDFSCLEGDCPAFLEVIPATGSARPRGGSEPAPAPAARAIPAPPADLPEPAVGPTAEDFTLRLIGIGGTGVVTVAQVLSMAALLDGRRTLGLDQTGLAQKGGPVTSDVRILAPGIERASRPAAGGIDVLLGFDLVAATAPAALAGYDRRRTAAVMSMTQIPTATMVGDPEARFAALSDTLAALERRTRWEDNVYLDAHALSQRLFGDHMPANTLLLGAAVQAGLIPISLAALAQAYRLNGAAVEQNLTALAWGRAVVADPDAVAAATDAPATTGAPDAGAESPSRAAEIIATVGAPADSPLCELLASRVPDLIAYQDVAYARRYAAVVREVAAAETAACGAPGDAAEAVARQLHRLMAYKDEYEVARLHLDPAQRARVTAEFGPGARIAYRLHPPTLRALGLDRKLTLGPWFDPALRALRGMRRVRGTALDPFGRAQLRRLERSLVQEYVASSRRALPHLSDDHDTVVSLLQAPEVIRGYEHVKLANVAAYRERVAALWRQLDG